MFRYSYLPIYVFLSALTVSYLLAYTPLLLALWWLIVSIVTYWTYAKDKSAAINGNWRVPENTLHLLSLLGGWPGAIIAQQRLRHKTHKVSFRLIFWLTLGLNVTAYGWLHTQQSAQYFTIGITKLRG